MTGPTLPRSFLACSPFVALAGLVAALYFKLFQTRRSRLPTLPGHWFWKNQELFDRPWRGPLLANVYKPRYGDIIQLSTPFKTVVVLNSIQAVSEVLEKQSGATSDRPQDLMSQLTKLSEAIGFRNHDETHKKYRRVMASALNQTAARAYDRLHTSTAAYFLWDLARRYGPASNENTESSEPLADAIFDSVGRFIIRLTYGHVVGENDPTLAIFKKESRHFATVAAGYFWVDAFPILRYIPSWFPFAWFMRIAEYYRNLLETLGEDPFTTTLNQIREGTVQQISFTSKLLEAKGGVNASEQDINLIKQTAQPILVGGSTTTMALVHGYLFLMSIYPDVAARVQAEIDTQIGRNRLPTLADREVLPYTDAVLQEVMRWCPVFPFGFEHFTSEDIQVRGYRIKKGTVIEANIWALMHDPSTYPYPHTFNPDRFLGPTPDPDPRRFVFGFGRRVCPGQHIANNGAFVTCAAFMSVFNIIAGETTAHRAKECEGSMWKMFTRYSLYEPVPFACTIKPRDEAALSVLETCKELREID